MSTTLLLVLVVLLAFVVGHLVTRYLSRYVWLTGVEYLAVGALLGPAFTPRILTRASLDALEPLISLLLGVGGFLVGLTARRRIEGAERAGVGFLSAAFVCAGLVAILYPLVSYSFPAGEEVLYHKSLLQLGSLHLELHLTSDLLAVTLAIGAAAACSSTTMLEGDRLLQGAVGEVTSLLRASAAASQLFGIVLFGLALAAQRAVNAADRFGISVAEWALAALLAGVVVGLAFALFIGRERDEGRLFLAAVGAITFASGIGSALGISPLFVNAIAGLVVASISPHKEAVARQVERLQHPLFVLLMIFAGAMWEPVSGRLWLLPVAYVFVRYVLRRIATPAAARVVMADPPAVRRLGDGLLAQGAIGVAIGISFAQRDPEQGSAVLTVVVLGMVASDLFAPRAMRNLLHDAGEIPARGVKA
ncbi:MAG: hypothetical protein KC731_28205 [Myxococcales bacterium]|nr:hypothetical protein [Myxococcales bacterium]